MHYGVLADLKASEGLAAARGLGVDAKCCQNLGNINIYEKSDAVAAVGSSVASRRCSHSNFIFAKPYKTYEILIFLWSKSRFPYKNKWKINVFDSRSCSHGCGCQGLVAKLW